MPRRRKVTLLLLVIFALLITGFLYLTTRFYLPPSPSKSYFSSAQSRLPQLHWLFGQFQPVFLYPFARGDSGFLKVHASAGSREHATILSASHLPTWHTFIRLCRLLRGLCSGNIPDVLLNGYCGKHAQYV